MSGEHGAAEPTAGLARQLAAWGLAALLTGGFAIGGVALQGGLSARDSRCEAAASVVADDDLNRAFTPAERRRIVAIAGEVYMECLTIDRSR